jgi:hypothetical protein
MANQHPSIPEPMSRLLAIFATDLAQVRFGDLDRGTLEAAVNAVEAAADALDKAEAAAAVARAELGRAQDELRLKGQRALAHARIYAESAPELAQQLEPIVLERTRRAAELGAPGAATTTATKRRGRPGKSEGTGTPGATAAAGESAEAT